MSARQHYLSEDDIAGLLAEVEALRDREQGYLVVQRSHEQVIADLRRQLAAARHPTVPADTVLDPHPASETIPQ